MTEAPVKGQTVLELACGTELVSARVGSQVGAVYGNFDKQPLADDSGQMIWVARPI